MTYRSYPGENAVLDASKPITGWQLHGGGFYKANVGTAWNFDILYENLHNAVKARYPNIQGNTNQYNRVEELVAGADRTSFVFAPGEIPAVANTSTLETYIWPGGVQGYQNWYSYTVDVSGIDYSSRTVTLTKPLAYVIGPGSRYFMQGAIELLDQPGEFFLDRTGGHLYYYPRDTANLNGGISAPFAGDAVIFKGGSPSAPVTDITFEGLTIRNTDIGKDGIHEENAERIHVLNNLIHNAGEHGIQLLGWAKTNRIEGNEIRDIGYNGVSIEGIEKTAEHVSSGNIVTNNHVHHVGKYYGNIHGNAGGIRIYSSGENVISHNRVHHAPRYGIHIKSQRKGFLVGTVIDNVPVTEQNYRDYQHARNNIIEYNDVSHATLDSQDAGVIAAWGTGTGNIIRYNRIHDSGLQLPTEVQSRSFGYGVYFDDNSDDILFQGNIIHSLQQTGGGFLNSSIMLKGIGIRVDNNIVANNHEQNGTIGSTETVGEISSELEIARNIFYENDAKLYSINFWDENKITHADNNLYYTTTGTYELGGSIPAPEYDQWLELQLGKFDQHSIIADPVFMNEAEHDYRLKYNSPAYKLGIADLDIESIGLKKDFIFADPSDPLAAVYVKKAGDATNKSWTLLSSNQSASLKVSARTEKGYKLEPAPSSIAFSTSNPTVATVNSAGVVQAVGTGTATITVSVTLNGTTKSTNYDVLVNEAFASIGILSPGKIQVGAEVKLAVYGKSSLNRYSQLDGVSIQYTSSNPAIAAVDSSGIVTGLTVGSITLNVSAFVGGNVYTASMPVEVYEVNSDLETYDFEGSGTGGWVPLSGSTWELVEEGNNHAYRNTSTVNSARSYLGHIVRSDYSQKVRMKVDAWGTLAPGRLGIIGRYVNPTNFYYATYEHTSQRFKLFKVVNGSVSTIASSPVSATDFTAGYREMKLVMDGTSLELYLDGVLKVSAADSSFSEGYPGLYAYNQQAYFDDIVIESLN
ncbi:MAG: Ig domain protein group 2 domain protein [Paenibacillus sp.]|nr:Ig domain protein group 2 domain protein [Paenibacillus sp.]